MDVTHGRGDAVVAQELLQGGQIRARFHEVRSKGMAQGVNTARLADPRPPLGRVVTNGASLLQTELR
jgi:hypothetical protein